MCLRNEYYGQFKPDFSDLPAYLEYIATCVPTMLHLDYLNYIQILVVKKYKNVAVCYAVKPLCRPVILYRKLTKSLFRFDVSIFYIILYFSRYNDILMGRSYFAFIYKLFVPQSSQVTSVFADLHAIPIIEKNSQLTAPPDASNSVLEFGIIHNGYFVVSIIYYIFPWMKWYNFRLKKSYLKLILKKY